MINEMKKCSGCYGCVNICPKGCIEMKVNKEGFWYPYTNKSLCINCDLCKRVCPINNEVEIEEFKTIALGCKNKNIDVRIKSSSGGIFFLLAQKIIRDNGVVFGATFNLKFEVYHTYAETIEGCIQFRGSKYVQSKIGDTYKLVKRFLDDGRKVLFSGTQCQIKGLNLFLNKKYENLLLVDIICHGVPSPLVFSKYINKLSCNNKDDIKTINFREKSKGWKDFSYVTEFNNGYRQSETQQENIYMRGFLNNLYLRSSCYQCSAKDGKSGADISLGDYWGINKIDPSFDDDKGTSLVLINSKKGKDFFDKVSHNVEFIEANLKEAINYNSCIIKPSYYNEMRKKFFKLLEKNDIEDAIEKSLHITFGGRIKRKIKYIIKKII